MMNSALAIAKLGSNFSAFLGSLVISFAERLLGIRDCMPNDTL